MELKLKKVEGSCYYITNSYGLIGKDNTDKNNSNLILITLFTKQNHFDVITCKQVFVPLPLITDAFKNF